MQVPLLVYSALLSRGPDALAADMDEAELEIAKSTPSFQLLPGEEPVLQM